MFSQMLYTHQDIVVTHPHIHPSIHQSINDSRCNYVKELVFIEVPLLQETALECIIECMSDNFEVLSLFRVMIRLTNLMF